VTDDDLDGWGDAATDAGSGTGGGAGEAESEGDEGGEDADGDSDEEGYLWVATGESCAQCEALDGRFSQFLPDRPHEKCDCEIRFTRIGTRTSSTSCENAWEMRWVGNTRYGPGYGGLITHWQITVTCWDGSVFDTIEDVDHGDDSGLSADDMEAEAWNELYDRAEEIAAQNCRSDCEPPRIS
jgi:hypothetical protein